MYKFERLKVYQLALDYIDKVYLVPRTSPVFVMAIRSLLETVACKHIIERRGYLRANFLLMGELDELGRTLARSLQAMRKSVLN